MLQKYLTKEIETMFTPITSVLQGFLSSDRIRFALFKYYGVQLSLTDKWSTIDLLEWLRNELLDIKGLARLLADYVAKIVFKMDRLESSLDQMNTIFSEKYLADAKSIITSASKYNDEIEGMIASKSYGNEKLVLRELRDYRKVMQNLSKNG